MSRRRNLGFGALAGILCGLFIAGYGAWRVSRVQRSRSALEARKRLLLGARDRADATGVHAGGPLPVAASISRPKFSADERASFNANLRQLHRQDWKAHFLLDYAAFFRSLHLSAAQVEAIASRWADRRMAIDDYTAIKMKNLPADPLSPDVIAANAGLQALRDSNDQELLKAFGEGGYHQFRRYQSEMPVRTMTDEMVNAAAAAGSAIEPVQAEALNRVLIAAATDPQGQIKPNAINWDAAMAQARLFLNSAQQDALKSVWENRQLWQKISLLQRGAVSK